MGQTGIYFGPGICFNSKLEGVARQIANGRSSMPWQELDVAFLAYYGAS